GTPSPARSPSPTRGSPSRFDPTTSLHRRPAARGLAPVVSLLPLEPAMRSLAICCLSVVLGVPGPARPDNGPWGQQELTYRGRPLTERSSRLRDKKGSVRYWAGVALEKAGPEAAAAVPDLVKLLKDDDTHTRRRAAEVLGTIGHPARAAIPVLLEQFDQSD